LANRLNESQILPRSSIFTLTKWQVHGEEINFSYECERFGKFTETLTLPVALSDHPSSDLSRLIDLLHAALGVSYYKAAAAQKLSLPAFVDAPKAQAMIRALYTEGLAEFFIRADLDYPPQTEFVFTKNTHQGFSEPVISTNQKALVAFGGGKDSYVADAICTRAGLTTELASVILSDKVADVLQGFSAKPLLLARRHLDPKIRAIAEQGAYNGHVPITAINVLILALIAKLRGDQYVVFANERSADEPTLQHEDLTANHQYSKSGAFEKLLGDAIKEAGNSNPHFFSVLRPFSELWIAQSLSRLPDALAKFSSCNRNFHIDGRRTTRWCGACAKCAFTTLMLAPFLSPAQMAKIFPGNFLDDEALTSLFRDLLGLSQIKPWDCVGTIGECRAALWQLSQNTDWQGAIIVKKLMPEVLAQQNETALAKEWQAALAPAANNRLPEKFMEAASCL
jgi:UDP-N-acetyl-alpha-D-muramoyl-L-alanyl-L-glutamate epimerase